MKIILFFMLLMLLVVTSNGQQDFKSKKERYIKNRAPLNENPYIPLPLGTIKPHGWLLNMLESQRDGLTGNLDEVYDKVCGPRNGWLGGDGDGWERGPYWIDGLLPLAYILDDDNLKAKAQEWVEWSLNNQREDGYFGPIPFETPPENEPGLQRGNRQDWWPKMVMLKVLQQYYMATGDQRVVTLMTNYFKFQLENLPEKPLGNWTFWGQRRGGDNLAVVYWLYNITGDEFLLDLGELIHEQTFDWTKTYSDGTLRIVNPYPSLHCVNVAQGLKEPVVYYQQSKDEKYINAVKAGLDALRDVHGFVNGMYGADESMHGNDPTQGSELCSVIEMMYSFENIIPITGDTYFADYLEKVTYNVLPTQHDDSFTRRQYFQQANQIEVSHDAKNYIIDEKGRNVFGVLTGYPCCTCNMHQGWPKFVQNLWYSTVDDGVAALIYGSSEVDIIVGGDKKVNIVEKTNYPFDETVQFTVNLDDDVSFPFHLRIPGWCSNADVKINGEKYNSFEGGQVIIIDRDWSNGDVVELTFPMEIELSRWYENSYGIERGPLVYALKMNEQWEEVKTEEWENSYFEVRSDDKWNYGILADAIENMDFTFESKGNVTNMPWNVANAPVIIKTNGKLIDSWKMYNGSAGKIPVQRWPERKSDHNITELVLIPYGCTTLRISEFPIIH
ncbi:MAG: glycoside hydrolase family 127 protein [Melioribacteraceae bacterium]|nr:glycoside hydrolase family 127 protein [Melioribacteraceae bacterium]MCF8356353.1 glycoside hydrolase family 127 protein [Melioribacteraceae bacterium]MCF8395792.1 glycoside hydrolase family 127 protein [Melioribacteraceae bacterium]MCF8420657.1 glycoside hydrolase family 127 protein [Melioribacteraceae bacterium]